MSVKKSVSGGVTHYSLVPDSSNPSASAPTEEFRDFVRGLGEGQISAAVALGQFQRNVRQTVLSVAEGRVAQANDSGAVAGA